MPGSGEHQHPEHPCPRDVPQRTHPSPSPAPIFQAHAGSGQTVPKGGSGPRGGGGGGRLAAPWCPGWPGLGPGCARLGFKVRQQGGGSRAGARVLLIPAVRVTSRTQAGPGLPSGIPAAALEPGGPVGREGCAAAALGAPSPGVPGPGWGHPVPARSPLRPWRSRQPGMGPSRPWVTSFSRAPAAGCGAGSGVAAGRGTGLAGHRAGGPPAPSARGRAWGETSKVREKQIKLFPFSRNNCLPN